MSRSAKEILTGRGRGAEPVLPAKRSPSRLRTDTAAPAAPSPSPRSLTLRLPWPPSVNHYRITGAALGGGKRMPLTREAREFRRAVHILALGQAYRAGMGPGPRGFGAARLRVWIEADPPPPRRRRDLDNVLKALLDALERTGLFGDDGQIDDLRITRRSGHTTTGGMTVTIAEIQEGVTA